MAIRPNYKRDQIPEPIQWDIVGAWIVGVLFCASVWGLILL